MVSANHGITFPGLRAVTPLFLGRKSQSSTTTLPLPIKLLDKEITSECEYT